MMSRWEQEDILEKDGKMVLPYFCVQHMLTATSDGSTLLLKSKLGKRLKPLLLTHLQLLLIMLGAPVPPTPPPPTGQAVEPDRVPSHCLAIAPELILAAL